MLDDFAIHRSMFTDHLISLWALDFGFAYMSCFLYVDKVFPFW